VKTAQTKMIIGAASSGAKALILGHDYGR